MRADGLCRRFTEALADECRALCLFSTMMFCVAANDGSRPRAERGMVSCCVPRSCPVSQSRRVPIAHFGFSFLLLAFSLCPMATCGRKLSSSAEAPPSVCISAAVAATIAAFCRGVRPNLLRELSLTNSCLHRFAPPPAPAPHTRSCCLFPRRVVL